MTPHHNRLVQTTGSEGYRRAIPFAPIWTAALLWWVSCAGPQLVPLTDAWPDQTGSYASVTTDWTRSARLKKDFTTVMHLVATFKSPQWRTAYVIERARQEQLPDDERQDLLATQKKAHEEFYEVQLMVATYDQSENNLANALASNWRVALVDDQGHEIKATEIVRDRRPRPIIRAYFPELSDFAVPYIAKFPRSVPLLRDNAKSFSLRVASMRGAVNLTWSAL